MGRSKIKKTNLGQYFTPSKITDKYSEVFKDVYNRNLTIVDPFVGEGHLLIAFLESLNEAEAIRYIMDGKIIGFDYDINVVKKIKAIFIEKYSNSAKKYFIYEDFLEVIEKSFSRNNSLKVNKVLKGFFVMTNPPYLARNTAKNKHPRDYKRNFLGSSAQDYYEIALLKYIKNEGIWILPSNVYSNQKLVNLRKSLFDNYKIENIFVYEYPVFKNTRISVTSFYKSNKLKESDNVIFNFINKENEKSLILNVSNGVCSKEWNEITSNYNGDVEQGVFREDLISGDNSVCLINEDYQVEFFKIDDETLKKINRNKLILRTVDTGSENGNLGLYTIEELFSHHFENYNPIGLITKKTSRIYTQIVFKDDLSFNIQFKIKNKFNEKINEFRIQTNLIMLTNFKNATGAGKSRKRIGFLETFSIIEKLKKDMLD